VNAVLYCMFDKTELEEKKSYLKNKKAPNRFLAATAAQEVTMSLSPYVPHFFFKHKEVKG
jgi:hypothetical protein